MSKSLFEILQNNESKIHKTFMAGVEQAEVGINLLEEGLKLQAASIGNHFITEIDVEIKLPNKTFTTTIEVFGEWDNGYRGNREDPPEPRGWIINSIKMFGTEVGLDSDLHQAVTDYVRDM